VDLLAPLLERVNSPLSVAVVTDGDHDVDVACESGLSAGRLEGDAEAAGSFLALVGCGCHVLASVYPGAPCGGQR